jgi:PknH-like protein
MLVTGRVVLAAACVAALAAGCSSSDDDPAPAPTATIDATTMRGALLQAAEIGPTWAAPADPTDPNQLVSICGGTTQAPTAPPGATVVAAPFADEGENGAQTLDQTALVYPDVTAAQAALTALRAVADGCPATVTVPAVVTNDRSEPAYAETVRIQPLTQDAWTGFAVIRHKKYEPKHPGTADTAVTVLSSRNVVLVDTYAIYRLNNASTAPGFDADWKKLVGSVLNRVG